MQMEQDMNYTVEQEPSGLSAGTYELGAFLQGGDTGNNPVFQLYIKVNDKVYTADTTVNGWLKWSEPNIAQIIIPEDAQVSIGVKVQATAKTWGAWDDFYLYKNEN